MKAANIERARLRFHALTAGLIVLLFAVNSAVLLRPIVGPFPSRPSDQNVPTAELRGPASSVAPSAFDGTADDLAISSMKLDCQWGTTSALKRMVGNNVRQVRFDFKSCDVESVVNETNGSEATLFPSPTKADSTVTDYVALAEKDNLILVKSKSGAVRHVTIQRAPASAE